MSHTETTADVIEFARACGQHRPVQLVLNPVFVNDQRRAEGEPTAHRLERPFVLIGRAADCDVRLRHPEVSYRHAYLQIVDGRALCVDLASRTGTRWKTGTKSYGWIEPGEDVGIGPFELSYREDDQLLNEPRPGERGDSAPAAPAAALEFLNGRDASDKPRRWPLRRSVTLVGASPACNVQLRHESVSKVHSSLVLTAGGLWVIDLLGRHGTRVNGAAVRCARLNDGDELQIGRFRMAVRLGASANQQVSAERSLVRREPAAPEAATAVPDAVEPGNSPAGESEQTAAALSPPKPPTNGAASPAERMYSERFILGLMDQFAAMQQQAMVQNQQQIMMLVQLFSSMHHSQQELIREELARVHEINQRLQELQGEMASQQATRYLTQSAAPQAMTAGEAPLPEPSTAQSGATSESSGGWESTSRSDSPTAALSDPAATADDAAEAFAPAEEIAAREAADIAEAASDVSPVPDESRDDDDASAEPDDWVPAMQHPDADAHAWLAEQMHQLEREREGRWRKVLRIVGAGRL